MSSFDAKNLYRNLSLEQYKRKLIPLVNSFVEEPQVTEENVKEFLISLIPKIKDLFQICQSVYDEHFFNTYDDCYIKLSDECVLKFSISSVKCIVNKNNIHSIAITRGEIEYDLFNEKEKITLHVTPKPEDLASITPAIIEKVKKIFK